MELKGKRIGFALTGSFCTFSKVMEEIENLADLGADLCPIMSETVWSTDTRFGNAKDFIEKIESITGKSIIHTIKGAEPIGPGATLDALIIAPCTGNTLAKLAGAVTDSCVAMAAKATLRNSRPVILAISTNDGLGGSAINIGTLLGRINIYFVPFAQDDPMKKPRSLMADFDMVEDTIEAAVNGKQIQPILR